MDWRKIAEFLLTDPPRSHAETGPERRQRWFDNGMAIIVAVAAILATWASFEASRWGGKGSSLWDQATIVRAESNRYASKAVEETSVDLSLWVEWEKAMHLGRTELTGFLRGRFSPALDKAQDIWLGRTVVDNDGNVVDGRIPPGTPLTLNEYVPPGQEKSEQLSAQAEQLLSDSARHSATAGRYVLLTVLFALVLFFGNVATRFTRAKVQLALGLLAVVLLVSAAVRMFLLPIT